jgi:hypothetical protein
LSERFRPPVIAERYFLNFFCDFQTRRVSDKPESIGFQVSQALAELSTGLATGRWPHGTVIPSSTIAGLCRASCDVKIAPGFS